MGQEINSNDLTDVMKMLSKEKESSHPTASESENDLEELSKNKAWELIEQ